jgi:RIO kinase 1
VDQVSRVEKHNPMKAGAIDRKRAELRGDKSKAEVSEITFESVREDAIRYGLATDVLYQMNAGKEASIFCATWKDHPIILKAYRYWKSSHQLSKKAGFIPAGTSKRTYCILGMMENFAVIEFDLLMRCFRAGVHVPTPIGRVGNFVTMRFIGDGTQPAPQLKDVALENPTQVLDQILDDYLLMYRDVHYVHGDLSKYNILWWQSRPWIIDVPQAYEVSVHCDMMKAESLLRRDIKNVLDHFESYGIYRDVEQITGVFLNQYIPYNLRNYRELVPGGDLL